MTEPAKENISKPPPNEGAEETEPDITVKCVTVGDTAVGKTCVLITYAKDEFPKDYVPTVFETYETVVEVNKSPVKFELWDTAGTEELDVLRPLSYNNTDVFLVIYSVVDRASFAHIEEKWVKDLKEKGEKGVPYILVGNKVDLRSEKMDPTTVVTNEDLEKLKGKLEAAACFEVSAKVKEGIKDVFDECIRIAFKKKKQRQEEELNASKSLCSCVIL